MWQPIFLLRIQLGFGLGQEIYRKMTLSLEVVSSFMRNQTLLFCLFYSDPRLLYLPSQRLADRILELVRHGKVAF